MYVNYPGIKFTLNFFLLLFLMDSTRNLQKRVSTEGKKAWIKGEMAVTWVIRSVWKERYEKDKGSYGHLYSRATSHAHIQRYKQINKLQFNKFKQLSFSFYRRILPKLSKLCTESSEMSRATINVLGNANSLFQGFLCTSQI